MIEVIVSTACNTLVYVQRCVNAMRELARRDDYNITVVNDVWVSKQRGEKDVIGEWCRMHNVNYEEVEYHSCTKTRNYGLRRVDADYYVIADDDGYVQTHKWIDKLIEAAESHPDVLLVGVDVVNEAAKSSEGFQPLNGHGSPFFEVYTMKNREIWGNLTFETSHVSSTLWLLKKKCMDIIGYLDEEYLGSCQTHDMIYTIRINNAGPKHYTYKVLYCGAVKVLHPIAHRDTMMDHNMKVYDRLIHSDLGKRNLIK